MILITIIVLNINNVKTAMLLRGVWNSEEPVIMRRAAQRSSDFTAKRLILVRRPDEKQTCRRHNRDKWRRKRASAERTAALSLPLSASDGRSAARRGSSPPAIRSVGRPAGDFTQQLRRNEMICPGAAAKCWMDTYSWDGYRSQL